MQISEPINTGILYNTLLAHLDQFGTVNHDRSTIPESGSNPPKARFVFAVDGQENDCLPRIEYGRIDGSRIGLDIFLPKPDFTKSDALKAVVHYHLQLLFGEIPKPAWVRTNSSSKERIGVSIAAPPNIDEFESFLRILAEKMRELTRHFAVLCKNEQTFSWESDRMFGELYQTIMSQIESQIETNEFVKPAK